MAGGWWFTTNKTSEVLAPTTPSLNAPTQATHNSTAANTSAESVTTSQQENINPLAGIEDQANTSTSEQNTLNIESLDNTQVNPVQAQDIDVASIALEPLSDEEFNKLKRLLRTDSNLRLEILEEFRNNTNPERARQLAVLLGPYNDPEIVQTASELAYSGDPDSQQAGLDLLRRLQPHNNEARDTAINLLNLANESSLLLATMNVLATPTQTATSDQRQLLADNLNNLSFHQDPNVRSQSIALIGRWDKNSDASREVLTRGLSDPDPSVRSRTAYAINNIQSPDELMINGLLAIAENSSEKRTTRYAALTALGNMPLTGASLRRYNAATVNVSRRNG